MLIFLIGYMGCGKSTIGRKLTQRLGWKLVDTDRVIEQNEGCTVAEIFDSRGEEYFREMERGVVDTLSHQSDDCIVSTGGGLPIWGDNMELLNRVGVTVYLNRTAENIASRLSANGRYKRPKLRGLNDEELVQFMSENIALREPTYKKATLVIDAVPLGDDAILDIIVKHIKSHK
ncbi:MAG: shikimate kinase [Rikenellaceae bacterium]